MICTDFIEQLLDYETRTADDRDIIDQHAASCESCREYRTALSEVDVWLNREFPSIQVSPVFDYRVRSRIQTFEQATRGPSLLPVILDFVGYFSLAVALAVTMILLFPKLPLVMMKLTMSPGMVLGGEFLVFMTAVGFAVKVYTDLKLDLKKWV